MRTDKDNIQVKYTKYCPINFRRKKHKYDDMCSTKQNVNQVIPLDISKWSIDK